MSLQPPRDLQTIYTEETNTVETPRAADDYPFHIALAIDGVVQQVFHVDEKLAAILLSTPTIIQCEAPANGGPDTGWIYSVESGTFSAPTA